MRKVIHIAIDVLLIALVFALTDILLLQVFHSESLWLELGIYIVLYGIVFGAKWGVTLLWNRFATGNAPKENEEM